MKFDELKNEQAIEALADMFDPIIEIMSDKRIESAARSGNKILFVKLILKYHARSVLEIMAISEGVPVDEYECNMLTLPTKILELFDRPEVAILFQSQSQKTEEISFGSAMESTEDSEE